ncbi:hypothetical protein HaLaN_24045 [Haematococcus lacustris]|uniref:Uncharacterized protein n=1 Tax=Haematococcus lacustris TaxID=44745 RepID=A0A699ZTI4_HAELA|nr:hypothetical protein HaLaN_24045 [Haematococcus lacustris]
MQVAVGARAVAGAINIHASVSAGSSRAVTERRAASGRQHQVHIMRAASGSQQQASRKRQAAGRAQLWVTLPKLHISPADCCISSNRTAGGCTRISCARTSPPTLCPSQQFKLSFPPSAGRGP